MQTNNGKKGGLLKGKPHYDKKGKPMGGIKAVVTDSGQQVELEGGEVIINKEASKKHWKELSRINQSAGGGVPILPPDEDDGGDEFADGGRTIEFNPNHLPNRWVYQYAKNIKEKYPKVWDMGGNIFGNEAFKNLERALKRGYWTDSEKWMYIKWQSFNARHSGDTRIAGIIANLKWLNKVDKGWDYMKQLIEAEIDKKYGNNKMAKGGKTATKFWKVRVELQGANDETTGFIEYERYGVGSEYVEWEIKKKYGDRVKNYSIKPMSKMAKGGKLIKRADGSYSRHGLWDSIRENAGSGRKPTKKMLKQEAKIKSEMGRGGELKDWEIIISYKASSQNGGTQYEDRFSVYAGDIFEAKEIAKKRWNDRWGDNSGYKIIRVASESPSKLRRFSNGGELAKGIKVEKEHSRTAEKLYNRKITPQQAYKEIAKDHLKEDSHYYSKLNKFESKMAKGGFVGTFMDNIDIIRQLITDGGTFKTTVDTSTVGFPRYFMIKPQVGGSDLVEIKCYEENLQSSNIILYPEHWVQSYIFKGIWVADSTEAMGTSTTTQAPKQKPTKQAKEPIVQYDYGAGLREFIINKLQDVEETTLEEQKHIIVSVFDKIKK